MKAKSEAQRLVQIDAALASIPVCECKPGCSACCGPVMMSRLEWERICARLGYTPKGSLESLTCPMLVDGKCSVYDIRPAICRLFGTIKDKMVCPEGCAPARKIGDAEARVILGKVQRLGA
jgi:Fe-S-cluster containining protein